MMEQQLTDRLRVACENVAKKWPEKYQIYADYPDSSGFALGMYIERGGQRWREKVMDSGGCGIDTVVSLAAEFGAVVWCEPTEVTSHEGGITVWADTKWSGHGGIANPADAQDGDYSKATLVTVSYPYPDQLSAYVAALCAVMEDAVK